MEYLIVGDKDPFVSYTRVYEISAWCLRSADHNQACHNFKWRHKGPVTSQSTDLIKWSIYPYRVIEIYRDINTFDKESLTPRYRKPSPVQLALYIFIFMVLECWWIVYIILRHKYPFFTSL